MIENAPVTSATEPGRRRRKIAQEEWERLKSILEEALELSPPSKRAELIRERFAEDALLLADAESLLKEAELLRAEPLDWFEGCAEQATRTFWDEELSRNGERIGAYVVVRQLGRGGMGAVYLGARADGQFEKQVAIKVLKRGMDTDEILHRFGNERQIVARLDHPNIARLLDGGTTEDGLPYFVMEFVEGVPVTEFVRQRQLPIKARLELFLKICAAVQVAHQTSVVHRDLKPSNILVTALGEPKLLDFGIAKLLEPAEGQAEVTATDRQHLTPSSASPEQARGEPVTIASDIYALGGLLYEILSGQKAHHFSSSHPSRDEVLRVLSAAELIQPSRVITAPQLKYQVQGDLDNIVLYAMRQEPALRYSSVAQFAEDIRRHLRGSLVQARPVTALYCFQRFITRNRLFSTRSLATGAALLAVGGGISALLLDRTKSHQRDSLISPAVSVSDLPAKSIAVLPFQNLSLESENAFFATGVQDAILTDLGKVADLKVIGRTSLGKYPSDRPRDLREVSRQLGVANVLEGSVQRVGTRIRLTATLIDARSGTQTWAETYDRDLADVFAIQSEIAQAIVSQLQVKLHPREKADMELPPTRDLAAYALYLQAKEIVDGYLDAGDPAVVLPQAVRLLEEAVRRDPRFVQAYCYAARANSIMWGKGLDANLERLNQAETALATASRLQPDSAEVHLANAEYLYRCGLRLTLAETELENARPSLPNSPQLYTLFGNVARRQGRWDKAERSLAKAVELDPRNVNAVNFLADIQIQMRKFTEAVATLERAVANGLGSPTLALRIGIVDFARTGRLAKLEATLAAVPADSDVDGGWTPVRVLVALAKGDFEGAERALAASPREGFQDVDFSYYYPKAWYAALISRARGDEEKAKTAFTEVRGQLENLVANRPGNVRARAVLAQVYAGLGLKKAALADALAAAARRTIEMDAYDGPLVLQGVAQVYVWTGDHDKALDVLERLTSVPGYLSYGYLLRDPLWKPVRNEARFQNILTSLAPR